MTIITKKVRLVAAPEPPFVGIKVGITVPASGSEELDYGIARLKRAEDCESITIDWGDGTTETLTDEIVVKKVHVYPKAGRYVIRISDAVVATAFTNVTSGERFSEVYNTMITSLAINATRLKEISASGFINCINLMTLQTEDSHLEILGIKAFKDCPSLKGNLYFPCVNELKGSGTYKPFEGCTGGIEEIHFAEANEAAITACESYKKDHHLGTPSAIVKFDL